MHSLVYYISFSLVEATTDSSILSVNFTQQLDLIFILTDGYKGVSHLSGRLIERFSRDQPELEINADDIRCVKLAG